LSEVSSERLVVRPAQSRRDVGAFIELPYRLYTSEPNWVPPLRFERRRFLDRRHNPFFEHARAQYFLAHRGDRVVGRISAQVDDHFQAYQGNRWGFFGFFECEDDPQAAAALLDAAATWLRHHDADRMVGPCEFTPNNECGVLVAGHERPPLILSTWSHRYYPGLLEGAGLAKAQDLLMWELRITGRDKVNPIVWKLAAELERRHGITVRNFSKRDLDAEIDRFMEVYNAAWERNWAFAPLTDAELRDYAKTLKPVLDENWGFLAEKDGEVVGAALTLPDFNQVLIHMNGRILPIGWAKALYWRRKIDRVRVFALGVKPDYQHTGVAAALYERHFDAAERTPQKWGEMGWVLETNTAMNRAMEAMGGTVVRRFRLYERVL
jgi:GNAT superfamily N-acetyltransferase